MLKIHFLITLGAVFQRLRRSPHIFESSWNPHFTPEAAMLQLRQPQRVLIEPDLFDGDFAEREIDRIIGTVALAPKQQFFVHTSRTDHLRQWATRGRNALITSSFIAGHAGLLLKSIGEDALSWKWLRHSPWLHLAGPYLPFPPRNLWIGIDLSSQRMADDRRADFLEAPIPRCFVWACPAEALDLTAWIRLRNKGTRHSCAGGLSW